MKEDNRNPTIVQEGENQNQTQNGRKRKSWRAKLALVFVCAVMMAASASASSGDSSSGLTNVLAQSTNATTLIGAAFDLITGNAYLALLMFFGLLGVAIKLFRKGKRAAR